MIIAKGATRHKKVVQDNNNYRYNWVKFGMWKTTTAGSLRIISHYNALFYSTYVYSIYIKYLSIICRVTA